MELAGLSGGSDLKVHFVAAQREDGKGQLTITAYAANDIKQARMQRAKKSPAFPKSRLINVGGIDEIDSLVKTVAEHSVRGGLVDWLAEHHDADAHPENFEIGSFFSLTFFILFLLRTAGSERIRLSEVTIVNVGDYFAGCVPSVINATASRAC